MPQQPLVPRRSARATPRRRGGGAGRGDLRGARALSGGAAVGRRRQSLIFSTVPLKKPLLEMTSESVVMFPFARPVSVISTLPVATTIERSHHQRDLQGRGGRGLTQGGLVKCSEICGHVGRHLDHF